MIAGGLFETAGSATAQNVATWNGTSWSALAGGGCDDAVHALEIFNGDLIAGGDFINAGSQTVNHIASWDGSAWHDLRDGMSGIFWPEVTSLTVHDGDLYAGGWFTEAGPITANFIARWDGEYWHDLAGGMDMWVWALGSYHGDLIAGGDFLQAGSAWAGYLARWDGTTWSSFGDGPDNWVRAIGSQGDYLYVGGSFKLVGGQPSYYLARWMDNASGAEETNALARALHFRAPPIGVGTVRFEFELPQSAPVRLTLHDVSGRAVATLLDRRLGPGAHALAWDGADAPAGVCFARLAAGDLRAERRLLYLR